MRFAVRVALVAAAGCLGSLTLISACTYTWDLPADAGGDGSAVESGSSAESGTQATDGGAEVDSGGGGSGGSGACDSSAHCGAAQVCVYSDHKCGAGVDGVCERDSDLTGGTICAAGGSAIIGGISYCACDRQLYAQSCTLYLKGLDLAGSGCVDDAGFQCGEEFCQPANAYCVSNKGVAHCMAWGSCSGNKSCACVQDPSCACGMNAATGGTTVTCP